MRPKFKIFIELHSRKMSRRVIPSEILLGTMADDELASTLAFEPDLGSFESISSHTFTFSSGISGTHS